MSHPPQVASCQEYFETLDNRFVPDAAKGVQAVYQFELSGEGGGTWHVVVDDGTFSMGHGEHSEPSAVVTAKASDYLQICNGKMNGLRAVMTRKMKIAGNLVLARKMQAMLPVGKP